MNERETEARLRDWIEAQASPAVPDDLRRAVAAIPATVALPWSERLGASFGWRPAAVPRLAWVLLLAGLLLALVVGSLAVGARRPDRTPVAPVPGFAWVRLPDDAAQFGDAVVSSVTAGGPGFVAVGLVYDDDGSESSAAVWVSADGYAWTRVPHDEAVFGGGSMAAVTAGGPGLVAVGSGVWVSADGYTWTRVELGETAFGGYPSVHMVAVTAGGPGLVAVGDAFRVEAGSGTFVAAVWVSTDGYAWNRIPHDAAVFGDASLAEGYGSFMHSVTAGGPGLVAVGSQSVVSHETGPAVWVSADGYAWTRISGDQIPDDPVDASASHQQQSMRSVTAGGPGLVAVGEDQAAFDLGAVWVSADGYSWDRVPHDPADFGQWDWSMASVTAGGPGLVAVGGTNPEQKNGGGAVWTSPDGLSWSRVPADEAVFGENGQRMASVAAAGPVIVAVGTRPCYSTCAGHESSVAWVSPPADR